jgi:ubiquitin-conjugating enzyme E2 J1
METDAKGQLGGLESSDATRRRMAKDSRNWKCPGCGKSNEVILKESEEAAKEADTSSKVDEKVPEELKMGWKDEMGQAKTGETEKDDGESAELAEGFVPTAPIVDTSASTPTVPAPAAAAPAYPAARPAQGVPQPTGTATASTSSSSRPPAVAYQVPQNNGVPGWLDKLIMAVIAALFLVILKVMLGL